MFVIQNKSALDIAFRMNHCVTFNVYVNYENITNNNKLFFRLSTIALRDEIALSTRATVIIISSLTINFP